MEGIVEAKAKDGMSMKALQEKMAAFAERIEDSGLVPKPRLVYVHPEEFDAMLFNAQRREARNAQRRHAQARKAKRREVRLAHWKGGDRG